MLSQTASRATNNILLLLRLIPRRDKQDEKISIVSMLRQTFKGFAN